MWHIYVAGLFTCVHMCVSCIYMYMYVHVVHYYTTQVHARKMLPTNTMLHTTTLCSLLLLQIKKSIPSSHDPLSNMQKLLQMYHRQVDLRSCFPGD